MMFPDDAMALALKVLESSKDEPIDMDHVDCKFIEC
jgi:hypothetical protein